MVDDLAFYVDPKGHLVCEPYTLDNLHAMADFLGIKRCWFHYSKTGLHHYDVPKKRRAEMQGRCVMVSSRKILAVILAGDEHVSERAVRRWWCSRY